MEGQTKALVSINGPIEVSRRDELVSETTIDIQFRPISGFSGSSCRLHNLTSPGPEEKTIELKLKQFISSLIIRTLNPRSLVQIVVQILSVDTASPNPVEHLPRLLLMVDECDFDDGVECGDVSIIGYAVNTIAINSFCD